MEKYRIAKERTAVVFNDMINGNLHSGKEEHDQQIEQSGLIQNSVKLVAAARELDIPIFWIRVERRADRKDFYISVTDHLVAANGELPSPTVKGSYRSLNIEELPVMDGDHEIIKPRFDPFIGTDMDIRLKALGIDTILLGGYSTNFGVESCARTARDLNYNVVVLSDCSYNVDEEAHNFTLTRIMPFFSRVMTGGQAIDLID